MYVFNNDGVVKLRDNACSTDKSQHVVVKLHSNAYSISKSQCVVCVVDSYELCSFCFDEEKKKKHLGLVRQILIRWVMR